MVFMIQHKIRRFLRAAVCVAVCLMVYFAPLVVSAEKKSDPVPSGLETIAENITIAGVDVAGMTRQQAKEALEPYVESYTQATFTLQANDKSITCTNKDLKITSNEEEAIEEALHYGASGNLLARFLAKQKKDRGEKKDIALTFYANRLAVTEFLKESKAALDVPAVDNTIVRKNGAFEIVDGQVGTVLSIKKSVNTIADFIQNEWDGSDATLSLSVKTEEPQGKKEDLLTIKDVLGTYTTNYGSSAGGRRKNVENGASKLNGKVLYPGETISVAANLAPINEENGYAMATAYENGQVVDSVGGGVCQISSTLYNAVIRAELKVTERSPHSMTVSYVEPSMDSAIAGDYKDLKFQNNQDTPIYIDLITTGSSITATIYGKETRPANREIEFVSEIVEEIEPTVVYREAADQPIGYRSRVQGSQTGYEAHLLKIVTVDGVEESNQIFNRSSYKARNTIIAVGTASNDPSATSAMRSAIATQDENVISVTMAEQSGAGAPAAEAPPAQEEETPAPITVTNVDEQVMIIE